MHQNDQTFLSKPWVSVPFWLQLFLKAMDMHEMGDGTTGQEMQGTLALEIYEVEMFDVMNFYELPTN